MRGPPRPDHTAEQNTDWRQTERIRKIEENTRYVWCFYRIAVILYERARSMIACNLPDFTLLVLLAANYIMGLGVRTRLVFIIWYRHEALKMSTTPAHNRTFRSILALSSS